MVKCIKNNRIETGAVLWSSGLWLLGRFAVLTMRADQLADFMEQRNLYSDFLIMCSLITGLALLISGAIVMLKSKSKHRISAGETPGYQR